MIIILNNIIKHAPTKVAKAKENIKNVVVFLLFEPILNSLVIAKPNAILWQDIPIEKIRPVLKDTINAE